MQNKQSNFFYNSVIYVINMFVFSVMAASLHYFFVEQPEKQIAEELKGRVTSLLEDVAGFRYNIFELNKQIEFKDARIAHLEKEVELKDRTIAEFKKQYVKMYVEKDTALRSAIIPEATVSEAVHNHVVQPVNEKAKEVAKSTSEAFEAITVKIANLGK